MKNISRLTLFFISSILLFACHRNPFRQGQQLYAFHCESCHMEDGSGLERLIPALNESKMLTYPDKLTCLIRNGLPRNPQTNQEMPANKSMTEVELTNLLNYLLYAHTAEKKTLTLNEINAWSDGCH